MITRIVTTDEIKPIFREYLETMSQFLDIVHYDAWCETALKNLQSYCLADDRYLFILKKSHRIIGFAMVNKHLRFNTQGFAMAEFYIQKTHEKKGYGRRLAEHVFASFPGNWEVAVALKNRSALAFWEQVVSSLKLDTVIKTKNPRFNGHGFVFNNGLAK